MKILITNDVYDIAQRLQAIDGDYQVYFDTERQKFLLMRKGVLELIFPFEELDERAIKHARYTSVHNINKIIYDLERENKQRAESSLKNAQNKIEDEFSRRLRLLGDKGEEK